MRISISSVIFGCSSLSTELKMFKYFTAIRQVSCGRTNQLRLCETSISELHYTASKRAFSTKAVPNRTSKTTYFKYGVAIGIGGSVLYATNDHAKHIFLTAKRVGVVTVATVRCFSLYKRTLDTHYTSDEERHKTLNRTHEKAAHIVLKALERNGGIYIKLGQHIAALTYLLPKEWTETMIPLQDRCPRSSLEGIEKMFLKDMGVSIEESFVDFDPNPVGVASLAQVHVARLRSTGEKVAVKFQHPSLEEFVPLDVYMVRTVFNLMYKIFPEYPLTWLGEEMNNSIYVELDFTNEAKNAESTAEYFKDLGSKTALRVPSIVSAKPRILVMDYIAGARLDNLKYMEEHNINTSEVSSCLSHIFNSMIFSPGVGLHCDPHGGNLAIRSVEKSKSSNGHNFEIILYDHGLYRNIPLQMKRDYSRFWLAVLDNDVDNMKKYSLKMADTSSEQKFKIFSSAITGRDPNVAVHYDITKGRSKEEEVNMQSQLHENQGALEDLMEILSTMPRVVLLILKTNDLTRNLDENLNNPLGPERTFLILANYCAAAVYDEELESIQKNSKRFSIKRFMSSISAWISYHKRTSSLYTYDCIMLFKSLFRSFVHS